MFELEDMSLEEKKQLLQAIFDSKQSQQQTKGEETSIKGGVQDVSSTTVEKRNDNNIVVQVHNKINEYIHKFFYDFIHIMY